uniref:PB1 domain-containing protein n=1 Tax=Gouania willdenowi TaxID=441366 RepID=A0A8C5HUA8_GOUWI
MSFHFLSQQIIATMDTHVRFRVLLDHIVKKVSFPEMPTLQELIKGVQETFAISEDISLQYKDTDFDDFFTLTSTDDLKDKDTLKIIYVEPPTLILSNINCDSTLNSSLVEMAFEKSSQCSSSAESDDTVILPPPHPTTPMHQPWPREFPLPCFSYTTEMALKQGMIEYEKDGTLPCHNKCFPHLKTNILECLADAMYTYTAYANDTQRYAVAEALVNKYPCLREPGSFNGLYGWQQSLKYKVGNYRTKLRALGVPEVMINTLKQKSSDKQAKNVKKAKKCESNYFPPVPAWETPESLEITRVQLLAETKKKNNDQVINDLMSQTFSLRRQEVLSEGSNVATLL